MFDVLVYLAVVGILVLIFGFEFGRTVDVGDDYISVTTLGHTKRIPIHEIDRALVRTDALESTVLVITSRTSRGSIVIHSSTRGKDHPILPRLVDLLRRAVEHGARVDPDVFSL